MFKGIFYDFYSEDLSQKVKSSIAARKAKGNYTASVATYGYKKDPEKKGHLIVDEEGCRNRETDIQGISGWQGDIQDRSGAERRRDRGSFYPPEA